MEQRTTARRTFASGATDSTPRPDIRIIDATSRWGEMAGRTLAELGAEIIKIEPPQGCEPRRVKVVGRRKNRFNWRNSRIALVERVQ